MIINSNANDKNNDDSNVLKIISSIHTIKVEEGFPVTINNDNENDNNVNNNNNDNVFH